MRFNLQMILCLLALLSVICPSHGEENSASKLTASQVLKDQFDLSGDKKCATKASKIAEYLGSDREGAGAVVYFDHKSEGQQGLLSSVIASYSEDNKLLGIVDVAQDGDQCPGTYELIKVWVESCSAVRQRSYPAYQAKATFSGGVELFEKNRENHLYLMPLPISGCLTVEKVLLW